MPALTRFPLPESQLPSYAACGSLDSLRHLSLALYCGRTLVILGYESCLSEAYMLQGLTFHVLKALSRFYPQVLRASNLSNPCFMKNLVLYQNMVSETKNAWLVLANQI